MKNITVSPVSFYLSASGGKFFSVATGLNGEALDGKSYSYQSSMYAAFDYKTLAPGETLVRTEKLFGKIIEDEVTADLKIGPGKEHAPGNIVYKGFVIDLGNRKIYLDRLAGKKILIVGKFCVENPKDYPDFSDFNQQWDRPAFTGCVQSEPVEIGFDLRPQ